MYESPKIILESPLTPEEAEKLYAAAWLSWLLSRQSTHENRETNKVFPLCVSYEIVMNELQGRIFANSEERWQEFMASLPGLEAYCSRRVFFRPVVSK